MNCIFHIWLIVSTLSHRIFRNSKEKSMALRFPPWVDNQGSDEKRATARLRYLVARAAIEATGSQSVRALAKKIEMDHSSISTAIRRGYFSEDMAAAIEAAVGRSSIIKIEHLTEPLKIKVSE
jgi:hypothetical protein